MKTLSMRSVLPEWYNHNDDEQARIVKEGTIALDANVLLDLYRVGSAQRQEILQVLTDVRERIFIPHQVALEYQKRRLDVAWDNERVYEKLLSESTPEKSTLESIRDRNVRTEIERIFEQFSESLKDKLNELRDKHIVSFEAARTNDPVRSALDRILADSTIASRPPEDLVVERRETAHQRIDDGTPPVFADRKKSDPTGDYLIWAELLEHARTSERPLLFVTGDKKSDWFGDIHGHSLGPRVELIIEMQEASPDHPYHQVDLGTFLHLANSHLGAKVEEATIETVKSIVPQEDSSRFTGSSTRIAPDVWDGVGNYPESVTLAGEYFRRRFADQSRSPIFDAIQNNSVFDSLAESAQKAVRDAASPAFLKHNPAMQSQLDFLSGYDPAQDARFRHLEDVAAPLRNEILRQAEAQRASIFGADYFRRLGAHQDTIETVRNAVEQLQSMTPEEKKRTARKRKKQGKAEEERPK